MSFTSRGFARLNWHSFAQLPPWRFLLWLPMTWRQKYLISKYLIHKYFLSIPSLTWTQALHLFLFSQKQLRWKEINTHTHTHTHTKHTHIHTPRANFGLTPIWATFYPIQKFRNWKSDIHVFQNIFCHFLINYNYCVIFITNLRLFRFGVASTHG